MTNETNNTGDSEKKYIHLSSEYETQIRQQLNYQRFTDELQAPVDYTAMREQVQRVKDTVDKTVNGLAIAFEYGWISEGAVMTIREALFHYDLDARLKAQKGDTPA